MIAEAELFATAGVIVAEVPQGVTREVSQIEHHLRQWEMLEPGGFGTHREAAAPFRLARAKRLTLTTIDALIAAIALEHGATVLTVDKDFTRMARITRLPLYPLRTAEIWRLPAHPKKLLNRVARIKPHRHHLASLGCGSLFRVED